MFIVAIWGLIVGQLIQGQFKYDYCKKINFEAKENYCSLQKELNEKNKK